MRHSYTTDVLLYLTARPGVDVDGLELARIGGAYAWRSRVAEARLLLEATGKGTIENRQSRVGQRVCSRYRYVPASADKQVRLPI